MTNWLDSLDDSRPVRAIYGDYLPSLTAVVLHEICLHEDGPRATLKIDLSEFPSRPPRKWLQEQLNTVQVELMLIGIRRLSLRGWINGPVVDLSITREEALIHVFTSSELPAIDIWSDWAMISRIAAYKSGN